jgi:hypothetical protein
MNTFRICYQANLLGQTKITFLDAEDETQAKEILNSRVPNTFNVSIENINQLKTTVTVNGAEVEALVDFDMEGDVDGAFAIIRQITLVSGKTIPDDPEFDLKSFCEEQYSNMQHEAYMKTGRMI